MTKQEQIEEMTKLINSKEIYPCEDDVHCEDCFCSHKDTAEKLYNAGYRKVGRFEEENKRLLEVNRQLNADYNRSLERLKSDCREMAQLKVEIEELKAKLDEEECDIADDYTIGFATYLAQKRRNEADEMQAEITRLKKENADLLKACEEKFTDGVFD